MQLSLYKQTDLERMINQKYQENGILKPFDLMNIDFIANLFNAVIHYHDGKSTVDYEDGLVSIVVLGSYSPLYEQREHFFHELAHPLLHGDQDLASKPLKDLMEIQANNFQLYASMPIYMFEEYANISLYSTLVKTICIDFCLPQKIVERRLNQINGRIRQARMDREAMVPDIRLEPEYSSETKRILAQLQQQLTQRGAM